MSRTDAATLVAAAVLGLASRFAGSLGDVVYLIGSGLAVVVALRGVARARDRRSWAPIAAALTVWWGGDALYAVLEALDLAHGPTASELFWLAGYPLLMTGVLRMVARRAPWALVECALDAVVFTSALGLAVWRFVLAPSLAEMGLGELLLQSLYPVGDALLIAAMVLLLLSPGRNGWSGSLLIAALAMTTVGDVMAVRLPDSMLVDPVLLLSNVGIAAAVAHRDRDVVSVRMTAGRRSRMLSARAVFLGVALWVPTLVAVLGQGGGPAVTVGMVVGSTAVCGVASMRFVLSARRREQAEAALYRRATLDQLTGLANRATLEEAVDGADPGARGAALLYLDLDGFKPVNDHHGHRAGDEVLIAVAARLRALAGPGVLAARVGGDEFALLLVHEPEGAEQLADDVVHDLAIPVRLSDGTGEVAIGASVGVLRWSGPATSQSVLHAADTVMYTAKRSGLGWCAAVMEEGSRPGEVGERRSVERRAGGGGGVQGGAHDGAEPRGAQLDATGESALEGSAHPR